MDDLFKSNPLYSLDENKQTLIGQADDLMDQRRGSDPVQIDRLGVVQASVPLDHQADEPFFVLELRKKL